MLIFIVHSHNQHSLSLAHTGVQIFKRDYLKTVKMKIQHINSKATRSARRYQSGTSLCMVVSREVHPSTRLVTAIKLAECRKADIFFYFFSTNV